MAQDFSRGIIGTCTFFALARGSTACGGRSVTYEAIGGANAVSVGGANAVSVGGANAVSVGGANAAGVGGSVSAEGGAVGGPGGVRRRELSEYRVR
jgi:hypothetical protein